MLKNYLLNELSKLILKNYLIRNSIVKRNLPKKIIIQKKMSNYIFVISFLDGCSHCVNFETKVNASGKTSLEELKEKISPLGLEIKEVTRSKNNPQHDFFNLGGAWFPSFYLLDKKEWNEGKVKGYVMGGEIINGTIKHTGSRGMNPNQIVDWVKSILYPTNSANSDPYFSYEARLRQLKEDGQWQ